MMCHERGRQEKNCSVFVDELYLLVGLGILQSAMVMMMVMVPSSTLELLDWEVLLV